MSFFSCVYQLLIGPLVIFYEFIYKGFSELFRNHGLCIIFLSLVMNFLLLPLYRRADAIQDEERAKEQGMAGVVAHIKKTFQGDERFMMLQAYYRQNHYKPFYVLKGFLPLALEIPFFIAAYNFLSGYKPLSGTAFGPIRDLGAPDQLLQLFGLTLNALPILMTLINCISGAVYTKGFPLKDKLQLYGMALLFLVLLYDSPAGLVIYWTLNNLFSLVKNILTRMKKGRGVLKAVLAAAGAGLLVWGLAAAGEEGKLPAVIIGALLLLPALITVLRKAFSRMRRGTASPAAAKPAPNMKMFLCCSIFLAVLTGMLIPSAVIVSSPGEFVHDYSPLRHILNASLLSFGLFVIWFGIFYYMFSSRGKRVFCGVMWALCGIAVVNYMFFGTNLGLLTAELYYDRTPVFTLGEKLLNLGILAAVTGALVLLYRFRIKIALWAVTLMLIAITGMSALNIVNIQAAYARIGNARGDSEAARARITLSRHGKNVVFIMLDAGISSYLPYIFEERPDVAARFSGFTYYPNTVSFAKNTNMSTPSLYGGYEYTPAEINRRSSESLEAKQNEALLVLPRIFSAEGYRVTVCDPPYAGYSWVPNLSVFDKYEGITAFHTEQGQFAPAPAEILDQLWQRNFFCYSLIKASPLVLQPVIYDNGYYLGSLNVHTQFENSYAVLKSLRRMTRVTDDGENTFLTLCNSATHEPVMLKLPDYMDVAEGEDPLADGGKSLVRSAPARPDIELSSEHVRKYYMVNTGALLRVSEWLDFLRENGLYDNTRIIIAADHGRNLGNYKQLVFPLKDTTIDVMSYNPLLLVKDFGSTEFTTDERFMTLADVPALLTENLMADPVNPFTGKKIEPADKESVEMPVLTSDQWSIDKNNGNAFQPDVWVSVHDNIFDSANWSELGEW